MVTVNNSVGATAKLVDRKTAKLAEERFLERISANICNANGVYSPLDKKLYDASDKNKICKVIDICSEKIKAQIKELAKTNLMALYDEMPKGNAHVYEIMHKELLGARKPKVIIAATTISPIADLLRYGYSAQQLSLAHIDNTKKVLMSNTGAFYYLCLFSPTGWDNISPNALSGSNFLIALTDITDGIFSTYFVEDDRWRSNALIFDLSTKEEKVEHIKRFVNNHTLELLMDELTEDFVANSLGYAINTIRDAFELMELEDDYIKIDRNSKPYRLTRIY